MKECYSVTLNLHVYLSEEDISRLYSKDECLNVIQEALGEKRSYSYPCLVGRISKYLPPGVEKSLADSIPAFRADQERGPISLQEAV